MKKAIRATAAALAMIAATAHLAFGGPEDEQAGSTASDRAPVCVGDAGTALDRFLSGYVEDLRTLYVIRNFDARRLDGVVFAGMEPAVFHTAVRTLLALQGEAAFVVFHLDPTRICAFIWASTSLEGAPEGFFGLPEAPVRFAYANRPLDREEFLDDARQAVETIASRIPLGEARAGIRDAPAQTAEMPRGATPLLAAGTSADPRELLGRVARQLALPEVTSALDATRQITLHLPGELAFLPLLALPLDGDRPLVETHAVTAIDRLTALLTLPGINADAGLPINRVGALLDWGQRGDYSLRLMTWSHGAEDGIAFLGDPEILSPAAFAGYRFEPLPGARQEAEELARRFNAEPVLGPHATRSAMLDRLRSSRVLHFAGHGVGSAEDPLENSFLVLSDGPLTAREIQAEMLNEALIVLSACDTGRGQALGAGVIGLARAFQKAGALGTVLSHWPVSDRSAVPFMLSFHDELTRNPPAEALRSAALQLRQDYPHPADWAAFGYFGTPLLLIQ